MLNCEEIKEIYKGAESYCIMCFLRILIDLWCVVYGDGPWKFNFFSLYHICQKCGYVTWNPMQEKIYKERSI